MNFTLDAIQTLAAVVDTGSFAGAGAQLHRVPSAVSYQIRQLEQSLSVDLFDRSGHRAVLTAAGRAVLDEGRFLLARARRIERLAARFDAGFEARLQVIVDGAVPSGAVLTALTQLGEDRIPTHVQLRTEFRSGVPERFEELEADLMLTLVLPDDPLLVVERLPDLTFVLVASPQHPAHQTRAVNLADLQEHLELSVHDSARRTSSQDTNLLPGARVFYVGDFAAKREGLLRGLGLGWMPLHLVDEDLERGELVELDVLPSARRTFPLALVTRLDRPLGRTGKQLYEQLLQQLSAPTEQETRESDQEHPTDG